MKFLLLTLIGYIIVWAGSIPEARLQMTSGCVLDNSLAFHDAHAIERFKITVIKESLPIQDANIRSFSIWADGKIYLVEETVPQIVENNTAPSNMIYIDELNTIRNANFVKLKITYEPRIEEQHEGDGTSPYYSSIKKTIEKETYLPLQIKREQIDEVISECRATIKYEKNFKKFSEIMIFALASVGIIGTLIFVWRIRKRKKSLQ